MLHEAHGKCRIEDTVHPQWEVHKFLGTPGLGCIARNNVKSKESPVFASMHPTHVPMPSAVYVLLLPVLATTISSFCKSQDNVQDKPLVEEVDLLHPLVSIELVQWYQIGMRETERKRER